MTMKIRILSIALNTAFSLSLMAQPKDVTKKYIENPDFGSRFAAWVNPGSFTYNTNTTSFEGRSGEVWMEKWVAKGSTLGSNSGMYQTLRNLPAGTYTLVASAKNVSQSSPSKVCTGAYLYAGQEQVAFNAFGDYSVVFTVANGKADIGVKLKTCNGNWVCVDNFRLYYNGVNEDSLATEQARLDTELAALKEKVANATPTSLKVTTYDFIPTGNTIALGRSTVTGTSKEKGFCWSKEGEPTIFDEKTTETFTNNGVIYVMRGLTPSTVYYVRPYAMTSGGYVAYGATKKIVTLPAGNMTYGYFNDNNGDEETCARINSASAECVWMYNNLSYIPGFYLSVHYVPGAGAGGGTADCSYGGWMRVSQNTPYQQTGTMLHETNHGVGVGTTGEWYNNSNLRAETSRGTWLGPMATKMVRFFDNDQTSIMKGDGTHMWPYGINGAGEDSYQPSNQCLYYANILITHAMHQDGLPCTSGVGFASPAYVFEQNDTTKYYIKSNDDSTGKLTGYLCASGTSVKWNAISASEAQANDEYAWNIKYDPKTRLYYFVNVGTGRMLSYASSYKMASRTNPTDAEKLHLMPARITSTIGSGSAKLEKEAFWVMHPNKYSSEALEATTTGVTAKTVNLANSGTKQQWIFLTADEMNNLDAIAMEGMNKELSTWIAHLRALLAVPHYLNNGDVLDTTVEILDEGTNMQLTEIEEAMPGYTSPSQATEALEHIKEILHDLLVHFTPLDASQPFDLTFLIDNPNFDNDASGWSESAAWSNSCCEYYQTNFDFYQTLQMKLPAATYEVRVQAFQRPGTLDDIYYDFVEGGKNNVNAVVYAKTKTAKVQNICEGATSTSLGSGSTKINDLGYIPASMASAQSWFKKGYYDNSVITTTTTDANFKLGIKSTNNAASGYWTLFDNFRLYGYGKMTKEEVTPIHAITPEEAADAPCFDLSGRRIAHPRQGLYISNGRKILVK